MKQSKLEHNKRRLMENLMEMKMESMGMRMRIRWGYERTNETKREEREEEKKQMRNIEQIFTIRRCQDIHALGQNAV